MKSQLLQQQLEALYQSYDYAHHLQHDPVQWLQGATSMHEQELRGLLASSLAFGNASVAIRKTGEVIAAANHDLASSLDTWTALSRSPLKQFVHRIYTGQELYTLLKSARRLQHEYGSIDGFLAETKSPTLQGKLSLLSVRLRSNKNDKVMLHLMPDPILGGSCKRLLLWCKWMVRKDAVDVGIWKAIEPVELLIPLDVHVFRIVKNLGLSLRAAPSWKAAEEVTARLREMDPKDPVKFDFALCHMGISKACPSTRDVHKCASCVLKPSCLHWK